MLSTCGRKLSFAPVTSPALGSAPVDELDALVKGPPKRREVVAYCRGPYCVYADDAVRCCARAA